MGEINDDSAFSFAQLRKRAQNSVTAGNVDSGADLGTAITLIAEGKELLSHKAAGAADNQLHTFNPTFLISSRRIALAESDMGVSGRRR